MVLALHVRPEFWVRLVSWKFDSHVVWKAIMTTLALLSWVVLIAGSAIGQAPSGPRADGFRGLILNQTSAEDGIRMLGQPAADKTDRLDVSKVSKWLDPKLKEKIPPTLLQERWRFFADSIIVSRKQADDDRVDI